MAVRRLYQHLEAALHTALVGLGHGSLSFSSAFPELLEEGKHKP